MGADGKTCGVMSSPPERCVLLVNRNAGGVDDRAIGRVCRRLSSRSPLDVAVTSAPTEAEDVIRGLGDRTLVVAGGDGTLHDALNRLDRHGLLPEARIALLPLGTANALARGIGLPLDPVRACDVVEEGRLRSLDLMETEDRVIANDVHTGIGVVGQKRVAVAKRVIGRFAYPVVNATTALTTAGWGMRVEVDGVELSGAEERALAVGVGNTAVIGNGTEVWPGASPDDGLLDVVIAFARGRAARMTLGVAVARGRHLDRDDVRSGRGREVRVSGGPGRHNADGELWHGVTEATYRVRPRGWRVMTG